jgi:hypothetical protein
MLETPSNAIFIPSTRARPGTLATHVKNTTEFSNDDKGADMNDKQPIMETPMNNAQQGGCYTNSILAW